MYGSLLLQANGCGEGPKPVQAVDRSAGGAILAADPAVVFHVVEETENIVVADLAGVRFVSLGHSSNLDVAAVRRVTLQLARVRIAIETPRMRSPICMRGQSCQLSILHFKGPCALSTVRVRSSWTGAKAAGGHGISTTTGCFMISWTGASGPACPIMVFVSDFSAMERNHRQLML